MSSKQLSKPNTSATPDTLSDSDIKKCANSMAKLFQCSIADLIINLEKTRAADHPRVATSVMDFLKALHRDDELVQSLELIHTALAKVNGDFVFVDDYQLTWNELVAVKHSSARIGDVSNDTVYVGEMEFRLERYLAVRKALCGGLWME